MLGFYTNFPRNVHRLAAFSTSISNRRLQHALAETACKLNGEILQLQEIASPSLHNCTIVFEFGIAEGDDFSFLDNQEKDKLVKTVKKKTFQVMDFLCAIRYYKIEEEKKVPLRFDYYMLRFVFGKNMVGLHVFHEKGPMHVSPEELVEFIINKVNTAFSRKVLKPSDLS
jgi:hypothetical protein